MLPYQAGGPEFNYPLAGDEKPLGGAKVLLLTIGCVCIVGVWDDSGSYLGWRPLPKRNQEKEDLIERLKAGA